MVAYGLFGPETALLVQGVLAVETGLLCLPVLLSVSQVLFLASADLIRVVALLVGDTDLFLQALLVGLKFANAILNHLGFGQLLLEENLFLELVGRIHVCNDLLRTSSATVIGTVQKLGVRT